MTFPVQPDPSNAWGIGGGASIANSYGVNITGGSILSSAGGGGAITSSTSKLEGGTMVYMGRSTKRRSGTMQEIGPDGRRITVPTTGTETTDELIDINEARSLPALWAREDPKKLQEFVNKGIIAKIPGFDQDMGLPEILSKWDDFIGVSVALSQKGQNWSPWDIMDTYGDTKGKFGTERKGDWVYDVATGKPVKYVGPTSKTKTSSNVNLTSTEDVRAIALQAMREALGRAPTAQEVAQFATTINAMEKAAPEVTTTTVQLKPNLQTGDVEEVSSSSATSGGVSQAAMEGVISGAAQDNPEAAKYQGGTTYFNALLGLAGGS